MTDHRGSLTRLSQILAGRRPRGLGREDALRVGLVQLALIDRQLDGADADTLAAFRMAWQEVFGEGRSEP